MMKWMIASDIHGSALYCEKLLRRFYEEKAQKLLLLGDILYHGPRNNLPDGYDPKKVITLLNGIKAHILCVRGNCDSEVDRMVLEFPILADYIVIATDELVVYATHGHQLNSGDLPPLQPRDILLFGHTHIPICEKHGDNIRMNPGSVSIPKDNSYRGYMTLENNQFLWRNLDGNLKNKYTVDFSG